MIVKRGVGTWHEGADCRGWNSWRILGSEETPIIADLAKLRNLRRPEDARFHPLYVHVNILLQISLVISTILAANTLRYVSVVQDLVRALINVQAWFIQSGNIEESCIKSTIEHGDIEGHEGIK